MSYRYKNLYIMHYGVGHDKGGHSGRYPWGSGKNPYGGVDPTTKKSDLFKLNGRKFNDVASDLIVKKKYGNRTDVTEEQIRQSKARTQAFLRGLEATALVALVGSVGEVSSGFLQAGEIAKQRAAFDIKRASGQAKVQDWNRAFDQTKAANEKWFNNVKAASEKQFNDAKAANEKWFNDAKAANEKRFDDWSNANIKTFDNSAKTWDDIPLSTIDNQYWDELEFNSKKNNW